MKKILVGGFLIVLFALIRGAPVHAAVTNPNLKYFGYYYTDFNSGNPETYTSEIHNLGNSNVVRSNRLYSFLRTLKNNNLQAIMSLGGGGTFVDWEKNIWNPWKKDLPADLRDTIYAFYFDEPFWNGDDPIAFERITKQIHADFPDKAIMIVEAWPMFRDNKYTPTSDIVTHGLKYVTDIGLDFYWARENKSWDEYMSYYNKLKAISGNRKIWLVPDGYAVDQTQANRVKPAFDTYLTLANTDHHVVGMLNFVYGTNPNFPITLRQILQTGNAAYDPVFRAHQIAVGKAIVANNPSPTPTPTSLAGDLNHDNKVDIFDYNILVANFGHPYTIFDYNILVGNFGK